MRVTRFLAAALSAVVAVALPACGGDDSPAVALRVISSGEISLPENGSWLRELDTTDTLGSSFTVFAFATANGQQRIDARRFDRVRGSWGAWETVGDPPSRWSADAPTALAMQDGSILITWVETHLESSRIALRSRRWNPSSRLWETALVVDTGTARLEAATLVARPGGEAVALWTREEDNGVKSLVWSSLAAGETLWTPAQTLIAPTTALGVIQVSERDGNVALAWGETTTGVPPIRGAQPTTLRMTRLAASESTWSDPAVLTLSGRSADRFTLRELASTAAVLWTDFSVLDACLKATITTETTALTQSLACAPGDSPVTGDMALHPFGAGGATAVWIESAQPTFSTVPAGQTTWTTTQRTTSDNLLRWTVADGNTGPVLTGVTDTTVGQVLEQQRSTGPWASLSRVSFASATSRFTDLVAHRGGTALLWTDATNTDSILRASADIGRATATELGRRSSGLILAAASANAAGRLAVTSNTTTPNAADGVYVDLHSGRGGSWAKRVRLDDAAQVSLIDPPVWLGSDGQLLMTWWWQAGSAATATRRWAWGR
jgi:hypothetical protein